MLMADGNLVATIQNISNNAPPTNPYPIFIPTASTSLATKPLKPSEEQVLNAFIQWYANVIEQELDARAANIIRRPETAQFLRALIGYFKASRLLTDKDLTHIVRSSNIGIAPLFPQAIKYNTTGAGANTGYNNNSWDIPVTAGTQAFILGGVSAGSPTFYKTSDYGAAGNQDRKHLIAVFPSGYFEVGSSPTVDQFLFESEEKMQISPFVVPPFQDSPLKLTYPVYQYHLPGFWVDDVKGVRISFMPRQTKTMQLRLLGVVIYEFNFLSGLKYI
jgi:hypothetical protein